MSDERVAEGSSEQTPPEERKASLLRTLRSRQRNAANVQTVALGRSAHDPAGIWLHEVGTDMWHWVERFPCALGSGKSCDLRIKGKGLARLHACIVRAGGGFAVEVLPSKDALNVNGYELPRVLLAEEDEIQLGKIRLRLHLERPAEATHSAQQAPLRDRVRPLRALCARTSAARAVLATLGVALIAVVTVSATSQNRSLTSRARAAALEPPAEIASTGRARHGSGFEQTLAGAVTLAQARPPARAPRPASQTTPSPTSATDSSARLRIERKLRELASAARNPETETAKENAPDKAPAEHASPLRIEGKLRELALSARSPETETAKENAPDKAPAEHASPLRIEWKLRELASSARNPEAETPKENAPDKAPAEHASPPIESGVVAPAEHKRLIARAPVARVIGPEQGAHSRDTAARLAESAIAVASVKRIKQRRAKARQAKRAAAAKKRQEEKRGQQLEVAPATPSVASPVVAVSRRSETNAETVARLRRQLRAAAVESTPRAKPTAATPRATKVAFSGRAAASTASSTPAKAPRKSTSGCKLRKKSNY